MDIADWYGPALRRRLRSADRLSEAAIARELPCLKTAGSSASALLRRVTSPGAWRRGPCALSSRPLEPSSAPTAPQRRRARVLAALRAAAERCLAVRRRALERPCRARAPRVAARRPSR